MGRNVAMLWHASFSILAGIAYFFCVLPRWPELMGQMTHGVGTTGRVVCGVLIALAALPVVFTLLRTRKPEYGTPQLALTLRTGSIVAHVLAGVLIVGTTISEIWLSLDAAGQYLFGVYGAAAAIAVLGIFAFYLSFVAALSPPPPKPLKPKKPKRQRRRRKGKEGAEQEAVQAAETEEAETVAPEPTSAQVTSGVDEAEPSAETSESTAEELPTAEDTVAVESPRGGLRNRRPTGKSATSHRRRRSRGGVALDD
ncbi:MAG: hypothetical protein JOZ23_11525 [Mycobacterium sp.]|nr:hypothetical protein [Mycobacterium sp.]